MKRPDLNLLIVFDAVMTERNVTRAASRVHMTQPAVSNAIARLRQVFADELFLKVRDGVAPTPRALEIWTSLRSALEQVRNAMDPAEFDAMTSAATFTISMTDYVAFLLVPPMIATLERVAPEVNLHSVPNTNINAPAMLDRGEIDFAAGIFGALDSRFKSRTLFAEDYVCAMRKNHPLASGKLTLEQYVGAKHLLISLSGDATGFVDTILGSYGVQRRIGLTVNQFSLAPLMVAQSDFVVTMSRRAIERSGRAAMLHVTDVPLEIPHAEVRLLWHERHQRSPAHEWMRSQIFAVTAAF